MVYKMVNERELLEKEVESDSELKTFIVNYVGEKLNPPNGQINIEMVISVLAQDFPDIVLALAEENFIRGYTQGLEDTGSKSVVISETPKDDK
jgi:hypothetical protein